MNEIGSYQENVQHLQSLGCDTANGKVSGGVLHNFAKGWALKVFGTGIVHFFKMNRHGHYPTLCGIPDSIKLNSTGDFVAPGNFPVCKNCLRIAKLQNLTLPFQPPAIESNARNVA